MAFFQNSVLNKHLNGQDAEAVKAAYQKFTAYFHNPAIQQNIRDAKEEQFQEGFLRELFVDILGYTLNPQPNFNLTTELKNEKGAKKADGAILTREHAPLSKEKENAPLSTPKALAVIELKGTDTKDLDKINVQAFNYKNNQTGCVYVITSNFEKLRFFIHHSVEHLEFNLFTLTETEFQLLWLCLSADNLLNGVPLKVKEESLIKDEQITKQLYKDYAAFRNDLWQNMVKNNTKADKLLLFKKTQKLLDRYLFIFFAEDSGLLPPNSISRIVNRWEILKQEDAYKPLYEIFQQYFGYINKGRKGQKTVDDIFAYNGGLFLPDEVLDNIKLDDDILHSHVMKLTNYDFQSEVDVNILGHIFENSLNEIENITAQLEGQEIDKSKSKRKKDGVFYTPKYITKYIVDNTVGKLCDEKKAELGIIDEEYAKGRQNRKKDTVKVLDENLQTYRNWLLNITICDPACGSGAFLNQALEFLIEEHTYVDELESQLLGHDFEFPGVENHILEKNIFGVDINEESVDIAKLSLWLRTAQRGRKLTTLNNNIKCGNSLIDDPSVAGEKAFNWQKEFPTVFIEKEKKAFHITTATHDSRTSQRMVDYKVRALRDNGLRPKAEAIWLEPEDEVLITETVAEIIKEDGLNVMAYNICGDHMHLLLVCEGEEVSKIMQKIKAKTARAVNINKGITSTREYAPLSIDSRGEKQNSLWTQKFGCKEITDEKQLWNTVEYIRTNREKHELPPLHSSNNKGASDYSNNNKGACSLVLEENELFYCSYEHAFRTEYKGGFDVVIGNPPYVKLEQIKDVSEALSKMKYKIFDKRGDLYVLFVERGFEILKKKGVISFIMPNKWLQAGYGEKLREFLLTKELEQLIDFGDIQIFEGATTYPVIFTARQNIPQETFQAALLKSSNALDFDFNVVSSSETFKTKEFNKDTWVISSGKNQQLLNRLSSKHKSLKKFISGGANYGIKPGFTEAFIIDEETKNKIVNENENAAELIKPMLRGRDIQPWFANYQNYYFICTFPAFNLNIDEYPSIKNHLLSFSQHRLEQTGNKGSRKKTNNKWFETQDTIAYHADFSKPKIMYQKFQVKPCFIYDESGLYCNDSMWIIPTDNKALLGILNSRMGWWLITKYCTQIQNGCQLIWNYFGQIPIPEITSSVELTVLVEAMIAKTAEQQELANSFILLLQSKFEIEKLTTKLQNWYELEFGDFLKELEKVRKQSATATTREHAPLSLSEQAEWMQFFNEQKQKAQTLKSEINRVDGEIDNMVYQLYGLTEEEIKIVEGK